MRLKLGQGNIRKVWSDTKTSISGLENLMNRTHWLFLLKGRLFMCSTRNHMEGHMEDHNTFHPLLLQDLSGMLFVN